MKKHMIGQHDVATLGDHTGNVPGLEGGRVILPASSTIMPDKVMAANFLAALDPAARQFTFQFFSDGDSGYAEVVHGSLDEVWPKVQALNTTERRIGAFVTINETDLRGRRGENIVRPRALFVDADGDDQVQSCRAAIRAAGAEPTMVVRSSPGRAHFYFCCDDLPRDQFSATQSALIEKLGTDRAVKDLARVMRLPGTLHLKNPNAPCRVTMLLPIPARRWSFRDLTARLGLSGASPRKHVDTGASPLPTADAERLRRLFGPQYLDENDNLGAGLQINIAEIASAVAAIAPPFISTEPDWMKLARGLAHEACIHTAKTEELWKILDTASASAPGYDQQENRRRFLRYIDEAPDRYDPITIASVFDLARKSGWSGWHPEVAYLQGTNLAPIPTSPLLAAGLDVSFTNIPHRQMLYGIDIYVGENSVLAAPGASGKTSLAIGMCVCLASNNAILGEKIWIHKPKVLYINGEDSRIENLRRIWAFCLKSGISQSVLSNLLLVGADDERTKKLSFLRSDRGASVLDQASFDFLSALLEAIRPKVVVLDPLIAFCAGGNANDNAVMALVMRALKGLAAKFECAFLVLHHTRKGGEPGHPESISGASSIVNLARKAIMIVPMTEKEADKFGIPASQRRSYFKVVSAKSNMSPPSEECPWYQLETVTLPNAEPPIYPNGDNVQAIVRVTLSELKKSVDPDDQKITKAILDVINRGKNIGGKMVPYSPNLSGAKNEREVLDDAMAAVTVATAPRQWHESDLRAAAKRAIERMEKDGWLTRQQIPGGRFRRGQGLEVVWDETPWPNGSGESKSANADQEANRSDGQLVNGVVNG
jgi:hypothetical protein